MTHRVHREGLYFLMLLRVLVVLVLGEGISLNTHTHTHTHKYLNVRWKFVYISTFRVFVLHCCSVASRWSGSARKSPPSTCSRCLQSTRVYYLAPIGTTNREDTHDRTKAFHPQTHTHEQAHTFHRWAVWRCVQVPATGGLVCLVSTAEEIKLKCCEGMTV